MLLWIVCTCKLDIFQLLFGQNSRIWKTVDIFWLRFFRLEIKATPFPPREIRAIRTSFTRLCITTNALFPATSSLSLFSPRRAKRARHAKNHHAHEWRRETVEARKKEINSSSRPSLSSTTYCNNWLDYSLQIRFALQHWIEITF